jgi:hypothetical protein
MNIKPKVLLKKSFVLLETLFIVLSGFLSPAMVVAQAPPIQNITQSTSHTTIQDAIDDASSGDVIEVSEGEYEITSQIDIDKDISIEGQGDVTIKANNNSWSTTNGEKHLIGIYSGTESSPVTIEDITMDCNNQCYGLNTYDEAYGVLDNVSIINGKGAALTVNGSTIIADNLSTENNAWGSVNVDPGSGVEEDSNFELLSGDLSEGNQIWSDGTNVDEDTKVNVSLPNDYVKYSDDKSENGFFWTNRDLNNVALIEEDGVTYIYYTIQGAIDEAEDGDEIKVRPGTYEEQLTIKKDISLIGVDNPVIKMPGQPNDISINGSSHDFASVIFGQGESGDPIEFNIDGFEINGNNYNPSDRAAGVLLEYVEGNIENLNVNNLNLAADTFGIATYEECDLVIEENHVTDFGNTGIVSYYDSEVEITNNEVVAPAENATEWTPNGIQISYGATGSVKNNIVKNSRWYDDDWSATAILVVESSEVMVEENTVLDSDNGITIINRFDGLYGGGVPENNVIQNNEVKNCNQGITIDTTGGDVGTTDISDNYFENNKFHLKSWLEDDKLDPDNIKDNNEFALPVRIDRNFDDAEWAIVDKTVLQKAEYDGSCSLFGTKADETLTFTFSDDVTLKEHNGDNDANKVFFEDSKRIRHNKTYVGWTNEDNKVTITSQNGSIKRPKVGELVTDFKGVFDLISKKNYRFKRK